MSPVSLFHLIESQTWHNHEFKITTQKKDFFLPQGLEPWSPGTESQCATYELC